MRPRTVTRPSVGARMPAIARSRVDLPAPLRPTTASTLPFGTVNETSRSAGTIRVGGSSSRSSSRALDLNDDWPTRTR